LPPQLGSWRLVQLPTVLMGTRELDFANDFTEDNFCTSPFAIEIKAVDTQRFVLSQSYYVQFNTSDCDNTSVTTAIPSGVASSHWKKRWNSTKQQFKQASMVPSLRADLQCWNSLHNRSKWDKTNVLTMFRNQHDGNQDEVYRCSLPAQL
jgi:hypothetical protein